MRCGALQRGAVRCGAVRCGAARPRTHITFPIISIPDVPLHAPDKDPYLANLAFFEPIDLSSPKLHEVYNKAIRWPAKAADALDVTLDKFLHHHLTNLDETAPMAAILLFPRMLLYPTAPGLSRKRIADEVIQRVRVLENGGARVLSDRNDWLAHASPSDTWRVLETQTELTFR